MSTFKEMPLDTTLQVGDIVTITGPGEHDLVVREVTGVRENGIAEVAGWSLAGIPLIHKCDRPLTRVQRPVPALPTVEGDYILRFSGGAKYVRTLAGGDWFDHQGKEVNGAGLLRFIESGATLTRVIPADEAKHPEVDVEKVIHEYWELSLDSWRNEFREVMRRVLEGEFDL